MKFGTIINPSPLPALPLQKPCLFSELLMSQKSRYNTDVDVVELAIRTSF
jgi:hypothetical protein